MPLIGGMNRKTLRKLHAPTPRLTLWVPAILSLCLALPWLGLVALFHR
jgi:hypothetical protein